MLIIPWQTNRLRVQRILCYLATRTTPTHMHTDKMTMGTADD